MRTAQLLFVLLFFIGHGSPIHAKEINWSEVCKEAIPKYVHKVCANEGDVSSTLLSIPNLCKEVGERKKIEKELHECGRSNIYSESLKYSFHIENRFSEKLDEFINFSLAEHEGLRTNKYHIYDVMYIACQHDGDCYAKIIDKLSETASRVLVRNPLFCDFSSQRVESFLEIDVSFLTTPQNRMYNGFIRPVCRQFYCQYKACNAEREMSSPFILDSIWDDYYKERFLRRQR